MQEKYVALLHDKVGNEVQLCSMKFALELLHLEQLIGATPMHSTWINIDEKTKLNS